MSSAAVVIGALRVNNAVFLMVSGSTLFLVAISLFKLGYVRVVQCMGTPQGEPLCNFHFASIHNWQKILLC